MASTVVTYNTITLRFVETGALTTEPIYDESGAQVIAWRTTADFNGLAQDPSVANFASIVSSIETLLMTPRKRLQVQMVEGVSTTTLIDVTASNGGLSTSDCDNGPRPVSVRVYEIAGGRAAFVQFRVSWTFPAVVDVTPKIIGHRWSQSFDLNAANYSSRVVEGVLTFSTSAPLSDLTTVDLYRKFIYPKAVPGFMRNRQQYIITSDNRQLRYVIEDREGYRRFPGAALTGSGRYITRIEGQNLLSAFILTLTGGKDANPGDLAKAAFDAMRTRINVSVSPSAGGDLIRSIEFDEDLFENTVSLKVQAESVIGDQNSYFRGTKHFVPLESLPPSQAAMFNQPSPHGSAIIAAAAQALFDISSNTQNNPSAIGNLARAGVINASNPSASDIGTEILSVNTQGPIDQVLDAIKVTDTNSVVSPDQRSASRYVDIQMRFDQHVENNLIVVSAADPSAPDEVQQIGKPTVVENYTWSFTRLSKPPVIPDIVGRVNASGGRRGYVRRSHVQTYNPVVQASNADMAFRTDVDYELVVPFNAQEFSTVNEGGVFVVFNPSAQTAFPASPAIGPNNNGQGPTPTQLVPSQIRL